MVITPDRQYKCLNQTDCHPVGARLNLRIRVWNVPHSGRTEIRKLALSGNWLKVCFDLSRLGRMDFFYLRLEKTVIRTDIFVSN